jgi:hypothetical protein
MTNEDNGWSDGDYGVEDLPEPVYKTAPSIEPVITTDPTKPNSKREFLTQEDIMKLQKSKINEVTDSLGISESLAAALLIKFGWNPSVVTEHYCTNSDIT